MKNYWFGKVIKIIFFVALAIFTMTFIVMQLWNHLMPHIFGLNYISYTQALGILILSKILFGGFKGGWGHGRCGGGYGGGRWGHHGQWRKRWEEKIASMTPEEREKMRKRWGDCGYGWEKPGAEENVTES